MIYFIKDDLTGHVKIGHSKNPLLRLRVIQVSHPGNLELACVLPGGLEEEVGAHEMFRHLHVRGEWFKASVEIDNYLESRDADRIIIVQTRAYRTCPKCQARDTLNAKRQQRVRDKRKATKMACEHGGLPVSATTPITTAGRRFMVTKFNADAKAERENKESTDKQQLQAVLERSLVEVTTAKQKKGRAK